MVSRHSLKISILTSYSVFLAVFQEGTERQKAGTKARARIRDLRTEKMENTSVLVSGKTLMSI